jgi:Na+/H+ antiporter
VQDPHVLQVLVVLLLAVLTLGWLAEQLPIPAPVLLLLGGVPLGFLPWTAGTTLPPEIVLLVFLPMLLYWESLTTSLREIRANLRVVVLAAVLLVVATAAAVATVGHALGLSWSVAWVLGAVVAPTDATATSAVAGSMPRRQLTILRAESLINDGTALVIFAIAVSVATGEEAFSWPSALGEFALSYGAGILAGLAVAWLATGGRQLVRGTVLENGISVASPFVAYLLAEEVHASGVLAVVVCGLAVSRVGPRLIAARTRVQAQAFWQVTTFLLNGTLFVLVGMQLRPALDALRTYSVGEAVLDAALVAATVIGTRLAWLYTTPYVIRLLDRRPAQRPRRVGARQRLPLAWAGFRGGVSLAAALAVPLTLADGTPFPARDLIIVVTFGVILVTLLVQGLTLPAVLRFARLPEDTGVADEENIAHRRAVQAGLAGLPGAAARLGVHEAVHERVRAEYEERLRHLDVEERHESEASGATGEPDELDEYERLLAALLVEKRAAVVALRDAGTIDDIVLIRVQRGLDAEEIRLDRSDGPDE